ISYYGSRVIFSQWFDELSRKEQKYLHFLHNRIVKVVTKFYFERKRQPELYFDIMTYGPGFDNNTLAIRNKSLNAYITFHREMDIAGINFFLGFDNFSDSLVNVIADKFDVAAFTCIGIITLL